MRAAYAALILGIIGGLILATGALSGGRSAPPVTVAAALAVDVPGVDLDRRRAEAVAVLVARCMVRRGSTWIPWVEPTPPMPDPELGPVEWAERWGFGITTMVGRPPPIVPRDPNLDRLGELGPDERDALRHALYGVAGAAGCHTVATDDVYGRRERLMAPIRPALDALEARIDGDPAVAEAIGRWRDCVEPVADGLALDRRLLWSTHMARFADRARGLSPTPSAAVRLAAMQADERRIAAVLARCEEAFSVHRATIAAPHETAFVDAHRETLARIGAAIREAEAALPTLSP